MGSYDAWSFYEAPVVGFTLHLSRDRGSDAWTLGGYAKLCDCKPDVACRFFIEL